MPKPGSLETEIGRRVRIIYFCGVTAAPAATLICLLVNALRPKRPQTVDTIVPLTAFLPTVENNTRPNEPAPQGMVWIPGGEFSMGSDMSPEAVCGLPGVTRDAQPIHRVYVDGFWMDATDVTNEQFARFVAATSYITVAEGTPTSQEFPGAPPENLVTGSMVFTPPPEPVPLDNPYNWWRYQKGANWRHPEGPSSSIKGRENY